MAFYLEGFMTGWQQLISSAKVDVRTGGGQRASWTKPSASCSTKRCCEKCKTVVQVWAGENLRSSGPKPQADEDHGHGRGHAGGAGAWTWWKATTSRGISWVDIWWTPQGRLLDKGNILHPSTSPRPLPVVWERGQVPIVQQHQMPSGCKIALMQGRFR